MSIEELATVVMGDMQWLSMLLIFIAITLIIAVGYLVYKLIAIENQLNDVQYEMTKLYRRW